MKTMVSRVRDIVITVLLFVCVSMGAYAKDIEVLPPTSVAMVDINTANAETLASELNGIGMKKAGRIVAYRELHGDFKSVDDITFVKGVGPKFLEVNRDLLATD